MTLSIDELNAMADARTPRAATRSPRARARRADDAQESRRHVATAHARQHADAAGLQKFVLETITPLNQAVGDAWMQGELQIFEEHLYTEQMQVALRTAINAFPRQTGTPGSCSRLSRASSTGWDS
jgi:hypothetical protein